MMKCEHALKNMDDFLGKTMRPQDAAELQGHLDRCPDCRQEFRQEAELLAELRSLPVPPPSKDFVKRTLATARARHTKQSLKQFMPYWGGAVAACLALWLIVAGPFDQLRPPAPADQQAISIKINEQRLVQVVVNAPRDLLQAHVIIELPPQVEMAGFPGRREVRWDTNLRKGKNLLSLPLIAKGEGIAELTTHITHENKSKILSLIMNISHDELTRTGHYSLRSA